MALGDISLKTEIALPDTIREVSCVHVAGGVVAVAHKIDGTNAYRISTYTIGTDGSISSVISSQDITYTSGVGTASQLSQIFKIASGMYAVLVTWAYASGPIIGLGVATIGITDAGVVDAAWTDTLDIKLNDGHLTAENKYAYTVIQIGTSNFFATPYTFSYDDGGATTYKQMLVVIEINSVGAIANTVSAELELGTTGNGQFSSICHVSGSIYAVAWSDNSPNSVIQTVDISSSNGAITTVASRNRAFTKVQPKIASAFNNKFIIAEGDPATAGGNIISFSISNDGITISAVIDTATWINQGFSNWVLKLFIAKAAYFIVTGTEGGWDGWARIFRVNPAGIITLMSSREFYLGTTFHTEIIFVRYDGDERGIYLITYKGTGANGFLETISIVSGLQYPSRAITRITGIRHLYNAFAMPQETYNNIAILGGISPFATFGRRGAKKPIPTGTDGADGTGGTGGIGGFVDDEAAWDDFLWRESQGEA